MKKSNKKQKEKMKKLNFLMQDLNYLQNNLIELLECFQANIESDENVAKLHTLHFNFAVHEINIFYKEILDLCVELYWNNPSYIQTPQHKIFSA